MGLSAIVTGVPQDWHGALRRHGTGTMAAASGAGLVGLVVAVALRQPPAVAVPPGLVALGAWATLRRHLRGPASGLTSARGGPGPLIGDRCYATAYHLFAAGVLVGLFTAFVAVHEAGQTIEESAIHSSYWAVLGVTWLLPDVVQAWRGRRPRPSAPTRPGRPQPP